MISAAEARSRLDFVPGCLNAASPGLPPREVAESVTVAIDDWRRGQASPAAYDQAVTEYRCLYAGLVGVPADRVAVGSQVSVLAGMAASALPSGAPVVCAAGDFSSVIFPFLVHAGRGVTVRQVPISRLAGEIGSGAGLVSFSLVISACGSFAAADAVIEAASRADAMTLCDLTQAVGWMPGDAARLGITAGSAGKWRCGPRGSAFMTISANVAERICPASAGWYAGQDAWASVHEPEMHLAYDARRFDVSPAWLSLPAPSRHCGCSPDSTWPKSGTTTKASQASCARIGKSMLDNAGQQISALHGPRILPSPRVADHLPRLPGGGARARRGPDHPPRPLSAREARGGTATPATVATREAGPRPIVIMHGAAGAARHGAYRRPCRSAPAWWPGKDAPSAGKQEEAMKTIGLLGGMSWESSIVYERIINEETRRRLGGTHSADLLIRSYDFAAIEQLQSSGQWDQAGQLLADGARRLEAAGAQMLLLCTNTMHEVADMITAAVSIPFLHIADVTAAAIKAAGLNRVGLLGTRYAMERQFYRGRLQAQHLSVLVPDEPDRTLVHQVIYEELVQGIIRDESRKRYIEVIDRLRRRGAGGIIAGCTEIELLVQPEDVSLPYFPTTWLHALAAVDMALTGT